MSQVPSYNDDNMANWYKVEAPVVDHLSDFGADHVEYEVVEIFPM